MIAFPAVTVRAPDVTVVVVVLVIDPGAMKAAEVDKVTTVPDVEAVT
jgi:hypothetical protein